MSIALAANAHAKRVIKEVLEARRGKGLYLRYSNTGHRIRDCKYLLPARIEVNIVVIRPDGDININIRSRRVKISAFRVRLIKEALRDMSSNNFNNNDN